MRVLLLFLALSGCAVAIQQGPAGIDPDPTVIGQGVVPDNEILISRASNIGFLPNVATSPTLFLNGDEVGVCRVGYPVLLRVPDGTWIITASTSRGQVNQEVRVSGGEAVALRCGTTPVPSLGPKPVLTIVTPAP